MNIFTQDESTALPDMGNIDMSSIKVDTGDIAKLSEIDLYKAMNYHLNCLKNWQIKFLVFRASLKQGILPSDWKTALVTSLFKKGS